MKFSIPACALLAALTATAVSAQDTGQQLGKVTFPTSCNPAVQQEFERGVAMLHSYWFSYARKTFEGVLQKDPECAMAYWGIAVDLLGNSLVGPPSREVAARAADAVEKARVTGSKTPREHAWIEAIGAYYKDHDKVPVDRRMAAYNRAMEEMTERHPDDFEAWVFYALTLQSSAPKTDVTYANQLKSAKILEGLYARNPQHPGVSHFLIHAYDYPPLADKGLAAANRYAGVAPAVPHARHMPSHIYSMVGMWEESIASNASALEIQPDYYHAHDFSVYAALQLAQDGKARALAQQAAATGERGDRPPSLGNFTALAAMPARLVLERGDWAGAARLPVTSTRYPQADSLTRFARGLGMARSGDVAGAKGEIEAMEKLRAALQSSDQSYWAARTEEQMQAVAAWIALAEGNRDRAVRLMKDAADSEDGSVKHVAMENRLYPMREMYAELLLESRNAAAALKEYQVANNLTPNRYRGLYGAAMAAEAAGNRRLASDYFGKLVSLTKNADTARPELARAKAYLASR